MNVSEKMKSIGNFILSALVLVTAIAVFVPFSPVMPSGLLDPSWMLGINQAISQGLSFGKDIVFTSGPYGFIDTRMYHPATNTPMLAGSLYLAIVYWRCLRIITEKTHWTWTLIFCAVLAGMAHLPDTLFFSIYLQDALFFSIPLLIGLATFKTMSCKKKWTRQRTLSAAYMALLFSSLGLLPLIKGSLLILCVAVTILAASFFILSNKKNLAITALITQPISLLFFWSISGQHLKALPDYLVNMSYIISGYTEAMALNGNSLEIFIYVAASIGLLGFIAIQKTTRPIDKIFLCSIYALFLFFGFKEGFVRHDAHALAAGASILIGAALLPAVFNDKKVILIILMALFTWSYIDSNYINTSIETIYKNAKFTYTSAWNGVKSKIDKKPNLSSEFNTTMARLEKTAGFPTLKGTSDIYSYDQAYLIGSGYTWDPRPIFQSYSAYSPKLAEINKQHLLGEQAPDNIIFAIQPIDGRVPSSEDGSSWPILLLNYQPTQVVNGFLFLKKTTSPNFQEPTKVKTETPVFGERIAVPQTTQPLFAQIDIQPTLLGKLASILYKPGELEINIELNNGTKKQYRLIAGMAKSGFLVSPLIETTSQFKMLYGKPSLLNSQKVKTITILTEENLIRLWHRNYTITFSKTKKLLF